jgi:hypothetical protein
LEPHRLDEHIQNLKAKKERFPNEYDLIKAFLKEATKENQKEPVKKALIKLAVKVYSDFNITVEQIEKNFSPKWQRQLLDEIVNVKGAESSIYELTKHRWIIRNLLQNTDPKLIFGSGPTIKDSAPYSSKFLAEWLDRPHEANESLLHMPIVAFEYGKYQFVFENKEQALKTFTRCKSLVSEAPPSNESHVTIDGKQLDELIFDCRLATRQVPASELLQQSSPLLKISGYLSMITATTAANGNARAQLEAILHILINDNVVNQLSLSYRVILERNPLLSPMKHHIVASNIVLESLFIEHVSFVSHRFEALSLDAIKALFEVIHTQLTQFQQTEPKVTVQSVEQLTRKLKELALTVCLLHQNVQAIDSLYYIVPEFKSKIFDELRDKIELQNEVRNINTQLSVTKHRDPLTVIALERDAARLSTLLQTLDISTNNPRRALIEEILAKKACTALSEGHTQVAQQLFNYLLQASVRTSVVEWGHMCTVSLSGTPVFNEISAVTMPAEPLILEIMLGDLISQAQWLNLKKYIANLSVNSARVQGTSSHIVNICKLLGDLLSRLSETSDTMQVEGELDPLPDMTTELVKQLIATDYEWSASTGLLSRLNEHATRALSYIFLSALHSIQPPANPRTYFPERFVDTPNQWPNIAFDNSTVETLRKHEQRLVRLTYSVVERLLILKEKSSRDQIHLNTLLTSAELSVVLNEPRRAARQLLALGVLETFNWSSQAPMPVFEQAIPILILALNAMQHYTHAVVLCQCLAEVNYAVACKLIQDNFVSLKSEYFEFIWEIPLLELLIYIYSKLGQEKQANHAMAIMGRPEFNEHNTTEARAKIINMTKRTFLRKLTSELFVDESKRIK